MRKAVQCLGTLTALLVSASVLAAPTPTSGSIAPGQAAATSFTGGILVGPNPTSMESLCQENVTCETYLLTVAGAPADWTGKVVRIELTWLSATAEEYDIYVHQGTLAGAIVAQDASGGTNDKVVFLDPSDPSVGTGLFVLHVSGSVSAAADNYKAAVTAVAKPTGISTAVAASGIAPSFQIHNPPAGFGNDSGEPSIGVNPFSGKIFYEANLQTLRATADDSCPNTPAMTWEDTSAPTSKEGLDPIMFTDPRTGRTHVSQLTAADSLSSYTDDDGKTWIPSQGGGIPSGIDHQTMGGGPFHAPLPSGAVYSDAVYYCTQADAEANCALSVNGGLTFGPAVPIYNLTQCGGLHGHIKVGPDGTAYVPNDSCGNGQAVVVSEDNGITWTVRPVPFTQKGRSDPSVAVDRGGRLYMGMSSNDTQALVGISDDHGKTWSKVVDVGAPLGIHAVEFAEVAAGDKGRAAFMFLGSTSYGDVEDGRRAGSFHLIMATTYDGGESWFTQDLTPNDPVQRGGIWNHGGAVVYRNLLDFNDLTVDGRGGLVAAFADGCFEAACAQTTGVGNAYQSRISILRQTAGRTLFGVNDPANAPVAPGAPQVKVVRNGYLAYLSWNQSGNGGSPISSYSIYRATQGSSPALLATVSGSTVNYTDDTVDPAATYAYSVKATNGVGTSCGDNSVVSAGNGGSCIPGGYVTATFAPGLQTGAPANPSMDIRSLAVAEPVFPDGVERLVLTMKVASLASLPPDATWRIQWTTPSSPSYYWYVGMQSDAQGHVTYDYGTYGITSAVVTGVGLYTSLGTPDQGTFAPDGTITITVRKDVVGSPQPGDLLGNVTGKAYIATGAASREPLDVASGGSYLVKGNQFCAPATTAAIDDPDARIAYSTGWHQLDNGSASNGHFHYSQDPRASATLSFGVPAGQYGALTFAYARSSKGGKAEVFVDGVSQGILDFGGGTGPARAPQFGATARYPNLSPGAHTWKLVRTAAGALYIDGFTLENSYSNANPPTRLAATSTTSSPSTAPGGKSSLAYTAPAGSEVLSIVADSTLPIPLNVLVLDLAGNVVGSSSASNGVTTLDVPAPAGSQFVIQAVNASTGLADVSISATATTAR